MSLYSLFVSEKSLSRRILTAEDPLRLVWDKDELREVRTPVYTETGEEDTTLKDIDSAGARYTFENH
jgi:hypothetical protein